MGSAGGLVGSARAASTSSRLGSFAPHLLQNIASMLFGCPQVPQFFEPALIAPDCSKSSVAPNLRVLGRGEAVRRMRTCATLSG